LCFQNFCFPVTINEGSTKRKEIIAKFLDLQFFDKKFKFAKEDSISSKALVKKLEGRDYEKEILEAQEAFDGFKKAISALEAEEKLLESTLDFHRAGLEETARKISDIPTDAIDILTVESEIKKTKNQIISLSDSVIEASETLLTEQERHDKIVNLMGTLDYSSLSDSLVTIEEAEQKLTGFTANLEIATEKKKLLEDIPCGSSYPA
jgi:DNA repair exonuclease SbcCD ATPase subunit